MNCNIEFIIIILINKSIINTYNTLHREYKDIIYFVYRTMRECLTN